MLPVGHIGYTIGITWLLNSRKGVNQYLDYRLTGIAAIAPDLVDRIFFILLLPNAFQGRLFTHTLLSGLIITGLLTLIKKHWWRYGLFFNFHLVLDCSNPPLNWTSLLFWPFLGSHLSNLGFVNLDHGIPVDRIQLVSSRLRTMVSGYSEAPWWLIVIELTGATILGFFSLSNQLFRLNTLKRFVLHGTILKKEKA